MTIQDKKIRTWAVSREQPQFFVPLTFASFKDVRQEPALPVPRTPSPQAYHREIPCASEKNPGYCTGQALQQVLSQQQQQQAPQNEPPCPQVPYDQCRQPFLPNQDFVVPNANTGLNQDFGVPNPNMFMAEPQHNWAEEQGNWVDDPCMNMASQYPNMQPPSPQTAPPGAFNVIAVPMESGHMAPNSPQPQQSWQYCYDSAGNMHLWPNKAQNGGCLLGPTPEDCMIDLSPKAAQCNMMGPYPNASSACDPLRSDSMGSWDSASTTAPSMASYNSNAESMRSESMGSWRSSSGSSATSSWNMQEVAAPRPDPPMWTNSRVQLHQVPSNVQMEPPSPPRTSILGLFKEKLKPRSKGTAGPHRFE